MRNQLTLNVGSEQAPRVYTLQELRPKDIKALLSILADDLEKLDIKTLISERLNDAMALLSVAGDPKCCVLPPEGETWEDLGFSEIEQVIDSFKKVNAPFLNLVSPYIQILQNLAATQFNQTIKPEPSTTSAGLSPSEDTFMSGTTDGDSSSIVSTS